MRSRKRNQTKKERDAKVYQECRKETNWADLFQSGALHKPTVKELDKCTDYHHLQCKYLSKKVKIQSITHHYYTEEEEWQQAEDLVDLSPQRSVK